MSRVLYLDCFSGASGDMLLGALLDAGLPIGELREALGSLAIDGYEIGATRVSRAGVAATKFSVREAHPQRHAHERDGPPVHDHGHDHGHAHGHADAPHGHRTLHEIGHLIDRSALSTGGRTRARELFRRLAETEAAIHQMPIEHVHLHEVGALDSIIDIVGAVFGMEWFGATDVVSSPLNVGSGVVRCEHGTFPVPAPATAALLKGVPVYARGPAVELVTPTGALLVTAYARSFGPLPPMTIERIGYGAGDRDDPDMPNVLRILVGDRADAAPHRAVTVIECEIDDMNPQFFGPLMDHLLHMGALDVFYAPVQMKKNRPGTLVTVVTPPESREAAVDVLFRETTTIGVRFSEVARECLDRETVVVETPLGPVRFKIARRAGRILNASPEFDDIAALASRHAESVKTVQAIATKAYLDGLA